MKKHRFLDTLVIQLTVSAIILTLCGCGGGQPDIHTLPRETKAYESAPVAEMDQDALIQHLDLLATEMSLAAESGQFAEMHHLELALSKALAALEPQASPSAKQIIDTLKVIAVKIHEAGHDQNQSMAATLEATLKAQIARLEDALASVN